MTMLGIMYVMVGGAIGSLCRYLMMSLVTRFNPGDFPYGTFIVNILGGFLMGAWIAFMAHLLPARGKDLHLLFAVGVLGGFTTFSTFTLDMFMLIDRGLFGQVVMYAVGSVLLSLAAMFGGMYIVKLVV